MTNPSGRAREPELLAREILASVYDDEGAHDHATTIRANSYQPGRASFNDVALKAIVKALTPTPVEAGSGEIELVARAIHEARLAPGKAPEAWPSGVHFTERDYCRTLASAALGAMK